MFCCLTNRRPDLCNLAADLVVQTKVLKGFRIDDCGETRSVLKGGGSSNTRTTDEFGGYGIPPPPPGNRGWGPVPGTFFKCGCEILIFELF